MVVGSLIAGRGFWKKKEKKKVFLSLFSLVAGGSCFLAPVKTAPAGVVLSFFLIWPRTGKTKH